MNAAIIVFLALGIIGTGTITINGKKFNVNWFCVVALILFIIKMCLKTA